MLQVFCFFICIFLRLLFYQCLSNMWDNIWSLEELLQCEHNGEVSWGVAEDLKQVHFSSVTGWWMSFARNLCRLTSLCEWKSHVEEERERSKKTIEVFCCKRNFFFLYSFVATRFTTFIMAPLFWPCQVLIWVEWKWIDAETSDTNSEV